MHKLISSGTAPARKLNRARILVKVDVGKHAEAKALSDRQIARMLESSTSTVQRQRERFFERGLQGALERSKPDRIYKRSLEGRAEAHLIAQEPAPSLHEGAISCGEWKRSWTSTRSPTIRTDP